MAEFTIDAARDLVVGPQFALADVDPDSTPGFDGKRDESEEIVVAIEEELSLLQEKLYANGREHGDDAPSVLLVLQGMDTSGKGGIVRHVFGVFDPQGTDHAAFGKPTPEELEHDFLWRIEKQLPAAGKVGVFDRSHYEDVLIHRVRALSSPEEIERRYGAIIDFEQKLHERGTTVIKVMLHISKDEQRANLAERLDTPEKHWKYNPGDIDERSLWAEYQEAYEIALRRTSTPNAPWYCVPSNKKWYARMVVRFLLLGALRDLDLAWPVASFDVAEEQRRLAES